MLGDIEIIPDDILDACKRLKKPFKIVMIPQWEEHDAGANIYTEDELFDLLFQQRDLPSGNVLIVDDQSYISGRVRLVNSLALKQVIDGNNSLNFDGDIIFLWQSSNCLSIFHHEGAYSHVGW